MNKLLQQAFEVAARLPGADQDVLASRLLAELAAGNEFDRAIVASADKLAVLARGARRGQDRGSGSLKLTPLN